MSDERTSKLDEDKLAELARFDLEPRDRCGIFVLRGTVAGRFYMIDQPLIIGRAPDADVVVDDDDTSRRHAELIPLAPGRVRLHDLDSTNGTFVNGERVASRELRDGDRVRIGTKTVLQFNLHDSMEANFHAQLYDSATKDALTQCMNKRVFDTHLSAELSFCARSGRALTLAMLDIDEFKSVNDTFGHLAGDVVLRTVADTLRQQLRMHDVLVRYGGDEFVLLMREINKEQSLSAAERLRSAVEASPVAHQGDSIATTVTIGVAVLLPGRDVEGTVLVTSADEALLEAKRDGRNRVKLRIV